MERPKKTRCPKRRLGFLSSFPLHGPAPELPQILSGGSPTDGLPVVLGYRAIRKACITVGKSKNTGAEQRRVFLSKGKVKETGAKGKVSSSRSGDHA